MGGTMAKISKLSGVAGLACFLGGGALAQDLLTPPEITDALQFAEPRLQNGAVNAVFQKAIDEKQIPGAVSVAFDGEMLVHASALGDRDLATQSPAELDTIFRAYSMTKPVTAVAMMILHEEGAWSPDDPVTKFIPELEGLEVVERIGADGTPVLTDAARPPTIEELLTHTAGFSYGFADTYVDRRYQEADLFDAAGADDFVSRLASLPLAYQPGTEWRYSVAMDVQGVLIERMSGMSLGDFMQARIFGPLGMEDTGFSVPEGKRDRLATLYAYEDGLVPAQGGTFGSDVFEEPGFASGGAGLLTTAIDYSRFARMLLSDGALDGVRILAPQSVGAIMQNHLPPEILEGGFGIGIHRIGPGYGFGYNGVVVTDPEEAGVPLGEGSYLWDGAAATFFWVDPENDVVFVAMLQRFLTDDFPPLQREAQAMVQRFFGGGEED
ncbi:serine hydrolase domain-containing protein [Parvularcula oceani]|uniref:serine hydrolase domain-containing protein n=1 Tax=Parvularcula oceani TaxID=1247963 RepID=UPI000B041D70|nr:serine hydrolase domain-containing protein [Parvularcula oceani]